MSDQQQPQQPTEEQIRAYEAQLEEQMRQLRVEDVVVQTIVTLVNLGGRRAGLAPGTEAERDPAQLQMAYVQLTGQQPAAEPGEAGQQPGGQPTEQPGPAQSSGRLWVPGQYA
jgi:hypothetical protein